MMLRSGKVLLVFVVSCSTATASLVRRAPTAAVSVPPLTAKTTDEIITDVIKPSVHATIAKWKEQAAAAEATAMKAIVAPPTQDASTVAAVTAPVVKPAPVVPSFQAVATPVSQAAPNTTAGNAEPSVPVAPTAQVAQHSIVPVAPVAAAVPEAKPATAVPAAQLAAAPGASAAQTVPAPPAVPTAKVAPSVPVAPVAQVAQPVASSNGAPVAKPVVPVPALSPVKTPAAPATRTVPPVQAAQVTHATPAAPAVQAAPLPKSKLAPRAEKKKSKGVGIFHSLINDWKEVPDLAPFVDRCVNLLAKLLPELRREYTKLNVPKVLLHECDVYSTKEDYVVHNKTSIADAHASCRYSARRLGAEYLGDQDYKFWCTDMHEYLQEQSTQSMQRVEQTRLLKEQQALKDQLQKLQEDYADMMRKKGAIGRELDGLSRKVGVESSLACCPYECQMCSL